MCNKYLKKFSMPLATKEIKIKIALRFLSSQSDQLISRKKIRTHITTLTSKDVEKRNSFIVGENVNLVSHSVNQCGVLFCFV